MKKKLVAEKKLGKTSIRIYAPILTKDEYEKRLDNVHQAVANIIKGVGK